MENTGLLRRQFPVTLGYAGTTNRTQGKSITGRYGADFSTQAFAPGAAYVCLSRPTDSENVAILTDIDTPTSFVSIAARVLIDDDVAPHGIAAAAEAALPSRVVGPEGHVFDDTTVFDIEGEAAPLDPLRTDTHVDTRTANQRAMQEMKPGGVPLTTARITRGAPGKKKPRPFD